MTSHGATSQNCTFFAHTFWKVRQLKWRMDFAHQVLKHTHKALALCVCTRTCAHERYAEPEPLLRRVKMRVQWSKWDKRGLQGWAAAVTQGFALPIMERRWQMPHTDPCASCLNPCLTPLTCSPNHGHQRVRAQYSWCHTGSRSTFYFYLFIFFVIFMKYNKIAAIEPQANDFFLVKMASLLSCKPRLGGC